MKPWFFASLLIWCACKDKPAAPVAAHAGSGSARGSAADPWNVAPVDARPETPAERKARAEKALARVEAIEPKLAKLRGLTFDHPVPAEYQDADAFRAFVHREVTKEQAHGADTSAALLKLGLLAKETDIAAAEEKAFATQAAAYYDPSVKKFFLVMVPDSDQALDMTSAHELTHALQDQHFDLQKYVPDNPKTPMDDDVMTARRFIVEGDATLAMFMYTLGDLPVGSGMRGTMTAMLRSQLEAIAGQSPDEMMAQLTAQSAAFAGNNADMKQAADAMKDLPPIIVVPMVDSYLQGALVSLAAYEKGGWAAVDDLYKHPPESTEQVLHPADKLIGARDVPRHVTLPAAPAGGTQIASDTIGELGWQIYFSLWKHTGEHPELGWDGDRYRVVRGKDGALTAQIATVWDTPADAQKFADAYQSTLAARGVTATVKVVGDHVLIADDAALVDQLVKGTKFQ